MSLSREIARFNLPLLYRRTMGGVQLIGSALIWWLASRCLVEAAEQMSRIARKGFDFRGTTGKGVYFPALDVRNLAEGTILAVLSLCCLIGGVGLVGNRPWAGRWVMAYLLIVSADALWTIAVEVGRGRDFDYIVLYSLALIVPYIPLALIASSPENVPVDGSVSDGSGRRDHPASSTQQLEA